VIDEAKAVAVYVFGGGIDEDVPPVLLELPSRESSWFGQRR